MLFTHVVLWLLPPLSLAVVFTAKAVCGITLEVRNKEQNRGGVAIII